MGKIAVFEAYPLASLVADEMTSRGWNCEDVARRMPGDYGMNVGVMNLFLIVEPESLLVTDDLISSLSVAFGVSEQFFNNLHQTWLENPDCRQKFDCPEELLGGLIFPIVH